MDSSSDDVIGLKGFVFDVRDGELRDPAGERVALRPQSTAVLQCLARSAGRIVGKDELMQAVWPGVVVTDDSLVQCIKELRRALGDDEHRVIQTEPKRGYRLAPTAPPTQQPADEPAAFRQDIRFATSADGTRIAYAVSGDAPGTLVRAAHWMSHLEWDWRSSVYGRGSSAFRAATGTCATTAAAADCPIAAFRCRPSRQRSAARSSRRSAARRD